MSRVDQDQRTRDGVPVWRIGTLSGLVGMLCCVGPTVLALLGMVSAGTAYTWATNLYGDGAWWFRLAALGALTGLIWFALHQRNQCSVTGVRHQWRRLTAVLLLAVGTYAALHGITTSLGTLR